MHHPQSSVPSMTTAMRPIAPSYGISGVADCWTEYHDVFDEESCRYFLLEVGKRIVPCYPFTFGIEEVYGMILERYGIHQAADASSILQELLEDEHNASGFGDDGDIWRSWRHGWRHRNDDPAHPFVPHVGNVVLRPPTSIHLRRLKAENFLRQQRLRYAFGELDSGLASHEIESCEPSTSNPDHQLRSSLSLEDSVRSDDEQGQGQNNTPTSQLIPRRIQPVRDTVLSFVSLSQFPLPPAVTSVVLDGATELSQHDLDPVQKPARTPTPSEKHSRSSVHAHTSSTNVDGDIFSGLRLSRAEHYADGLSVSGIVPQETRRGRDSLSTQSKTRLENRKARLIDGKLFNLGQRPTRDSFRSTGATQTEVETVFPGDNSALEQTQARSRTSWLRGLRDALFRHKPIDTFVKHSRHLSVPNISRARSLVSKSMSTSQQPTQNSSKHGRSQGQFTLDGTADSIAKSSTSTVNLNKPLPLSPDILMQGNHVNSDNKHPLSTRVVQQPPSIASTISTELSAKSSKANFQGITRTLLETAPQGEFDLSPINETNLFWEREPLTHRASYLHSQEPWTSDPVANFPVERLTPRTSALSPPPLDIKRIAHVAGADNLGGIPHSQSAPGFYNHVFDPEPTRQPFPDPFEDAVHPRRDTDKTNPDPGTTRGRSPATPTSTPIRNESQTSAKTTGKRSRSPIKRLLGIGKSSSSRNMAEDNSQVPQTPPSTKKSSIKKWGDRIRYGFLTPDEEQLRSEDLAERHLRGETPPSRKSTFPVSLEPPTQAKLQSEIELYVLVTANRFLMKEAQAGRLSRDSVSKIRNRWADMGRPQVIEFHYDQTYQHDLISANVETVKFYGDMAKDPQQVHSILAGWRVMAREMSIRTLCCPDSVLRKHLHDAHRVLELLGAPFVTFLAFENMQIKSLQTIAQRQKERMDRKRGIGHGRSFSDGTRVPSNSNDTFFDPEYTAESFQLDRVRLSPTPSPARGLRQAPRKATGAEGAIMSLPLPPARMMRPRPQEQNIKRSDFPPNGSRFGKAIHEKPESLLI